MLDKAKEILEDSYNTSTSYKRFTTKIREELRSLQLKNLSKHYEKRKDMWAELHIRLYKEIYLVERVIVPRLLKYIDIDLKQGGIIDIKYNIDDTLSMTKLYNDIMFATNNRVINMKNHAIYIKDNTDDTDLMNDMKDALLLFDTKVKNCVIQNCNNQIRYLENTNGDDSKDVITILYDTIGIIDV